MSVIVRQDRLFAGEDFRKIFKSFQDIDFTAYDFDSIKDALIEYIRAYYPEDFNDYIESSEFIAIIELLAYYGTSLSFRTDLNSRENIIDTAERRESIIRLARMVNYQPKRNIAARGLFKLNAVETNEPLTDLNESDLNNVTVFWNDPNNLDWFDQFVQILNSAFSSNNPFGRPSKSGIVGNIPTDLYQLNNVLGLEVVYNVNVSVNGESVPIDIVNPDFTTGQTFVERHPNQNESFNMIYRNDSLGVSSANTGFFAYFKQGTLNSNDNRYDFPLPNRVTDFDIEDINQEDVYVQEINDLGEVLTQWIKVPALVGNNIIYNSLQFNERNIFEVISGFNDVVQVKFADGNFGNVPTGLFRTWTRTSIGRNIVIRPEDAQGIRINIPYVGVDGLEYNLVLTFDLEQTVSNSAPTETSEQVKLRAPQTYYTQNRMINNQDYNVLPLTFGNQIAKLKAVNRTFAGHSRYIDVNDPTGFHKDLIVFGEDGALYKEDEPTLTIAEVPSDSSSTLSLVLQGTLQDKNLIAFFHDTYVFAYDTLFGTISDKNFRVELATIGITELKWKTAPDRAENNTGYFIDENDDFVLMNDGFAAFVKTGATLKFENPNNVAENITVTVRKIVNFGEPVQIDLFDEGPIALSRNVKDSWQLIEYNASTGVVGNGVLPAFRNRLTQDEIDEVKTVLGIGGSGSLSFFGYAYDLLNDEWYIINNENTNGTEVFSLSTSGNEIDRTNRNSWLSYARYISPTESGQNGKYEFTTRGSVYVFESLKDVRFYWEPAQKIFDVASGKALADTIEILPYINTNAGGGVLAEPLVWGISGIYIYDDGYQETAKIEVLPVDADEDGTPDKPLSFNKFVSPDDYVIFEIYTDINGFRRTRPYLTAWGELSDVISTNIVVDLGEQTINGIVITTVGLFDMMDDASVSAVVDQLNVGLLSTDATDRVNAEKFIENLEDVTFRIDSLPVAAALKYKIIEMILTVQFGKQAEAKEDPAHFERNGKSFSQDISTLGTSRTTTVDYKWKHYAPVDQRVDPAISNIIDMIVLTENYYRDVIIWKDTNGSALAFPQAPTTEELRVQFESLNDVKSISDQIIYNSGKFKVLFGQQAEPELQATFKVVKIPSSNTSDNEIKTQVIEAIDEYFDINNWDYGETFFYTELAAFVHKKLTKVINSIVIVPNKSESEFGNLFEIPSLPDQLFVSTATVGDVEIVKNLTETNLRV